MFVKKARKAFSCVLSALLLITVFVGCAAHKPIVTLDKRNGEPLERIEVPYVGAETYKSGAMLFANPTRAGWFFNGWFLDEQCTQSAYGFPVKKDTTFYAAWVDSITVPQYMPTWQLNDYSELFTLTTSAEPYGMSYGLPQYKLTVNVVPKGDFTGADSSDRFEILITHYWLSDEKFLGEYVSDEVVAYINARIWLEKEKGFAVTDEVIIETYNNEFLEHKIYPSTFSNPHTKSVINYVLGEPTLQYNHANKT